MDETKSKEYQRHRMSQILHAAANQLGEAEMHKRLNDKRLLERVGLSSPEEQDHETSPLTESTMRRLVVYPLPKNMGPGESEGRRAARARALLLQHQNDEGAVYVDVAKVKNKDAYVAAAVAATTGKIVTSCSVRTRSASQAEEMAIALAARSPGVRTILSDSKTAIRSFSRGAVCGAAARALASDESNHVAAVLDVLRLLQEKGFREVLAHLSCTDLPQYWRRPRGDIVKRSSLRIVDWRRVCEGGRDLPLLSRLDVSAVKERNVEHWRKDLTQFAQALLNANADSALVTILAAADCAQCVAPDVAPYFVARH
ncbi:hypothetical protein MRX96_016757 [Rhipicephalus microplus]